jgi:hypothetical protein
VLLQPDVSLWKLSQQSAELAPLHLYMKDPGTLKHTSYKGADSEEKAKHILMRVGGSCGYF